MKEYRNAVGFPVSINVLIEAIDLRWAQTWFFSSHIQQPRYTSGEKVVLNVNSAVSVQLLSCLSDSLKPHGLQHARLPCPSPTPGTYPNSCASSWGCHPTISSSVVPFSSRLQSFPASGSFPMGQFFTLGGQSIGTSTSASGRVTQILALEWGNLLYNRDDE